MQAGCSKERFVDSINSCHPLEVKGEGDSCASRLVNSALCDSINSCHPLEMEGEGDCCANRLLKGALF